MLLKIPRYGGDFLDKNRHESLHASIIESSKNNIQRSIRAHVYYTAITS